ncbi:hypothetical protein Taro_053191 [Colocasia esculenta]|uniref:Uncharacterized protein n=1 Tax=Colocasia esculenta TaxID=4460 RepID=A0A843XLG9_COLES|nr:hypothetical protein [Colocasia esculenta]
MKRSVSKKKKEKTTLYEFKNGLPAFPQSGNGGLATDTKYESIISSEEKVQVLRRVNCGYNFSIQVPYQDMKTRSKAQRMHGTSSFGFGFGAHPVGGIC